MTIPKTRTGIPGSRGRATGRPVILRDADIARRVPRSPVSLGRLRDLSKSLFKKFRLNGTWRKGDVLRNIYSPPYSVSYSGYDPGRIISFLSRGYNVRHLLAFLDTVKRITGLNGDFKGKTLNTKFNDACNRLLQKAEAEFPDLKQIADRNDRVIAAFNRFSGINLTDQVGIERNGFSYLLRVGEYNDDVTIRRNMGSSHLVFSAVEGTELENGDLIIIGHRIYIFRKPTSCGPAEIHTPYEIESRGDRHILSLSGPHEEVIVEQSTGLMSITVLNEIELAEGDRILYDGFSVTFHSPVVQQLKARTDIILSDLVYFLRRNETNFSDLDETCRKAEELARSYEKIGNEAEASLIRQKVRRNLEKFFFKFEGGVLKPTKFAPAQVPNPSESVKKLIKEMLKEYKSAGIENGRLFGREEALAFLVGLGYSGKKIRREVDSDFETPAVPPSIKKFIDPKSGFHVFLPNSESVKADAIIYLSLRQDNYDSNGPVIVKFLMREMDRGSLAGRFFFQFMKNQKNNRLDGLSVSFNTADQFRVARMIRKIQKRIGIGNFSDRGPYFAERLNRGVFLGEGPSFLEVRAKAFADGVRRLGLYEANGFKLTPDQEAEVIYQHFDRHGIDINNPAFDNGGSEKFQPLMREFLMSQTGPASPRNFFSISSDHLLGRDLMTLSRRRDSFGVDVTDGSHFLARAFDAGARIEALGGDSIHLVIIEVDTGREMRSPATKEELEAYEEWNRQFGFQPITILNAKKQWAFLCKNAEDRGVQVYYGSIGGDHQVKPRGNDLARALEKFGSQLAYLYSILGLLPDIVLKNEKLTGLHINAPSTGWNIEHGSFQRGNVNLHLGSLMSSRRYFAALVLYEIGYASAQRYVPGDKGDPSISFKEKQRIKKSFDLLVEADAMLGLDWGEGPELRRTYQKKNVLHFLAEVNMMYVAAGRLLRYHIMRYPKGSDVRAAWDYVYGEVKDRIFGGREYEYSDENFRPDPTLIPNLFEGIFNEALVLLVDKKPKDALEKVDTVEEWLYDLKGFQYHLYAARYFTLRSVIELSMGKVNEAAGDAFDAVRESRMAISTDDGSAGANYLREVILVSALQQLGKTYLKLGKYKKGAALLQEVIELAPNKPSAKLLFETLKATVRQTRHIGSAVGDVKEVSYYIYTGERPLIFEGEDIIEARVVRKQTYWLILETRKLSPTGSTINNHLKFEYRIGMPEVQEGEKVYLLKKE